MGHLRTERHIEQSRRQIEQTKRRSNRLYERRDRTQIGRWNHRIFKLL